MGVSEVIGTIVVVGIVAGIAYRLKVGPLWKRKP